MKTAVSIPDALFKAAEAEAKRLGITRSKLYQIALMEYLKLAKSSEIKRRLTESYTKSPEPVDPFIQAMTDETMRRMEWEDEKGRRMVGKSGRTTRVRTRVSPPRRHHLGK